MNDEYIQCDHMVIYHDIPCNTQFLFPFMFGGQYIVRSQHALVSIHLILKFDAVYALKNES